MQDKGLNSQEHWSNPTEDTVLRRVEIEELLEHLSPREKAAMRLYLGLSDGRERTREEAAAELRISRERLRQIEKKAERRLNYNERIKKLREYLNDGNTPEEKKPTEPLPAEPSQPPAE